MEVSTTVADRVTDRQLQEAREGLVRLLHKKRFPREWIEREAPDAMAHAEGTSQHGSPPARKTTPSNLLVVIAYRRAIKTLQKQLSKPTTPIETIFHLKDESSPSPEEEAIRHERQERVRKAMSHLPEQERMLLTLYFYDDMSIREAGRQVGWGKSAANRHHDAALKKLKALLDPSRSA
jgi:RNA polymerase sigma factor (sigma-70 family)